MVTAKTMSLVENCFMLDKIYEELEGLQKSCTKSADEFTSHQNHCLKAVQDQWYRLQQISEALYRGGIDKTVEETVTGLLKEKLKKCKGRLEEIEASLPKSNGFLSIILGNIDVTIVDKDEYRKYKEKYETFKLTFSIVILALSLQSIFFSFRALDTVLHFLLLWYYGTSTIRESILASNETRMKSWWRLSHVINTFQAGFIILWPNGAMYDKFWLQFTLYLCSTSFFQLVQFSYWYICLYKLKALGEHHIMSEGFHSWLRTALKFLFSFIYFNYVFQLYNAYILYQLSQDPLCVEWQVFGSAILFFILFLGNTLTMSWAIYQKMISSMKKKSQ